MQPLSGTTNAAVAAHPDASGYHQWCWRGLFERVFGHETIWEYILKDGAAPPDHSPKNSTFSTAVSVWQRLPLSLTHLIGPSIVANRRSRLTYG